MKPNMITKSSQERTTVTELTICGVFTALTCIFTMYLQIRIFPAQGGLVHLGNVPLFFAAAFFGKKIGAVCGGVGMALSDLLTGWTLWAPFTLIIVGLMGLVFGAVTKKKPTLIRLIAAFAAVTLIKIAGYYVAEGMIYGNWIMPAASIPGNVVQLVTAAIISFPIIMAAKAAMLHITKKDLAWRKK